MAYSDYRLCDVCGEKAFYDANLNYETGISKFGLPPFRVAGNPQSPDPTAVSKSGLRLGYVGDWAVLCAECAHTHEVRIVARAQAKEGEIHE